MSSLSLPGAPAVGTLEAPRWIDCDAGLGPLSKPALYSASSVARVGASVRHATSSSRRGLRSLAPPEQHGATGPCPSLVQGTRASLLAPMLILERHLTPSPPPGSSPAHSQHQLALRYSNPAATGERSSPRSHGWTGSFPSDRPRLAPPWFECVRGRWGAGIAPSPRPYRGMPQALGVTPLTVSPALALQAHGVASELHPAPASRKNRHPSKTPPGRDARSVPTPSPLASGLPWWSSRLGHKRAITTCGSEPLVQSPENNHAP